MSNVDNPTFQHKVEFANSNQLQQVLDSGNFDGIGVIFDYMIFEDRHFLRLTNSILDIQEKIANDSTIKAIVQRTNNPSHFMVSIRKREIALDSLLPIIAELPQLSFPESNAANDDSRRKINLVYAVMYFATGTGSKSWPIEYDELLAMEKDGRVSAIKELFIKERNDTLFGYYKSGSGEMKKEEYVAVLEYSPTADEIEISREKLMNAAQKMFNTTEMVDDRLAEVGAKILGATSVVNDYVLLAESMIFDHRFTPPPPAMPDFLK